MLGEVWCKEKQEEAIMSSFITWEGGVVHLAGSGHVYGDRDGDGHGLCQPFRLCLLVAGVRPGASNVVSIK